jgi:hypothetical protein
MYKLVLIGLVIISSVICAENIDRRFAGVAEDIKVTQTGTEFVCWIKTTRREYWVRIPRRSEANFAVGDTVYEYWIDYQKRYLGSKNDVQYFEVLKVL